MSTIQCSGSMLCKHAGFRSIAWLLLLAASLSQAFGQATSGTITGQVTDPSGASWSGGNVPIPEVNKGVTFRAIPNAFGYYTRTHAPPVSNTWNVNKRALTPSFSNNLPLLRDT